MINFKLVVTDFIINFKFLVKYTMAANQHYMQEVELSDIITTDDNAGKH